MPLTLLVASDTHGRADLLLEAVRRAHPDLLLFLGDGLQDLRVLPESLPIRAVRGNCDWSAMYDAPLSRVEEIGGRRIYLAHGHTHGVKYGIQAAVSAAAEAKADVLVYGHTHIPFERTLLSDSPVDGIRLTKPLLVLCPGSLGAPPDGKPTFATLTVAPAGVLAGFGIL